MKGSSGTPGTLGSLGADGAVAVGRAKTGRAFEVTRREGLSVRDGSPRAPVRQAGRHPSPAAVVADCGACGRGAAEPGGQSRPGAARRPSRIAGEDGAVGEPSAPGRPSPVPDAGDEAQDGGDEALLTAARRAAAEHQDQHGQPITRDGRAPRPPRGLQPGRLRAATPARACRLEPPAPPDLVGSPHWRAPWSAEGGSAAGAVCPPGSTARRARSAARQAPRRRGNLSGRARRPRVGRLAATPARPVRSGIACRCRGGPPAGCPGRLGRSAELPDRLSGFANLSPVHVAS